MRSEITGHLHGHEIITDAQHGLCKRRSYETQLIPTAEDLEGDTDKGGQTNVILRDFSKAFEKCLLLKLDIYGISGKTERWSEDISSPTEPSRW